MKSFFSFFGDSAKEFKTLKCIVVTGMLAAVAMAIESFSIPLPIGKVNFAFLGVAGIGMLFGPVVGFVGGALCDVLGFIAKPDGGFLPLYTLLGGIQGFIYGTVMYHKRPPVFEKLNSEKSGFSLAHMYLRAIFARLLDVFFINIICNTYANIHYGFIPAQTFSEVIGGRILKNAVELAADIPLLIVIMPVIFTAYTRAFKVKAGAVKA